jgi:hypothetical protein
MSKKIDPYYLSEEEVTKHIIKKLEILWSKALYFQALDKLADLHAHKKIILTDAQLKSIADTAAKYQGKIVDERDNLDFQGKLSEEQLDFYNRRIYVLEEFQR